ncbi:MAG: 30S ribosomal protein S11 [Verrucomicrobiota bacterium]
MADEEKKEEEPVAEVGSDESGEGTQAAEAEATVKVEEKVAASEDKVEESSDKEVNEEASIATEGGEKKAVASEEKPEDSKPKESRPQSKVDEVFMSLDGGDAGKPKILKAKGSKNVHAGVVHVQATFNNTIVTVTDVKGNVIGWSTSGKLGFRGSRKSTAYAAQLVSQDACRQAMSHGLRQAEVRVKGPGSGRDSAVRAVQAIGIDVTLIKDVTPIPHNGCRPPKARRV